MAIKIYEYTSHDEGVLLKDKLTIPEYSGDILINWIDKNIGIESAILFELIGGSDIAAFLHILDKVLSETDVREKRMKAAYYFPLDYLTENRYDISDKEYNYNILGDKYFAALEFLSENLKILSTIPINNIDDIYTGFANRQFVIRQG